MKNLFILLFILIFGACKAQNDEISEPLKPILISYKTEYVNSKITFCDSIKTKAIATVSLIINDDLTISNSYLENIRIKSSKNEGFKIYQSSQMTKLKLFFNEESFRNRFNVVKKNENFKAFPFRELLYIPIEFIECDLIK